jgi:hypothetical protein
MVCQLCKQNESDIMDLCKLCIRAIIKRQRHRLADYQLRGDMSTLNILTGELKVKAVPLTAKILKQVRLRNFSEVHQLIEAGTPVLGWVDGDAFGKNGDYLLIRVDEGQYVLCNASPSQMKQFPQLFIV